MSRGVSTAVDVVVFLALVSAAVVALATVPGADTRAPPDATPLATTLAGTTATVEYEIDAARPAVRRAHGTLAGLLATATVERARAAGTNVSPAGGPFGRAVAGAVRDGLGPVGGGWQVIVRWDPYPGGELEGSMTVGDDPPPGVAVAAERLTVPTGLYPVRDPEAVARTVGVSGLAAVVAETLDRRFASGSGALPTARARRLDTIFGTDGAGGMADTIERQLDDGASDPVSAAKSLAMDRVTVVVRRWST